MLSSVFLWLQCSKIIEKIEGTEDAKRMISIEKLRFYSYPEAKCRPQGATGDARAQPCHEDIGKSQEPY